ncbi:sialate O-acetylesterase [Pseudopedobacter beijingensis]|uniref:Sialate O-acetylesterase n=1 Tax=Pseudopedobacter beijingensis TaxID=1207056 RepID=A0ABW4ID51_9SPHI
MKITIASTIILLLLSRISSAEIIFPSIIGNGMVLQQQFKAPLWGESNPGKKITIITSWDNKSYQTVSDQKGLFKITVNTPGAGGPYSISFNDGKEIKLSDVYIGEVWVCSGQSNMELPVRGSGDDFVLNSKQEILNAENKHIRLFRVDRYSTPMARTHSNGAWQEANAKSVSSFSAVGYFYAKILEKELKVPVGIIETAWSGTRIEAWMSAESLSRFPMIKVLPKEKMAEGRTKEMRNNPSGLFNGMVMPVIGYGIKGVIWYQGEANRLKPLEYFHLFPAMVEDWRQRWGQGNWPFYYVQIAPYSYPKDEGKNAMMVPLMREVQLKSMDKIPNSGMVISVDAGSENTIHPPDKQIIAQRLANWALANDYGKKEITFMSPLYVSKQIAGNKVKIQFKYTGKGLVSSRKALTDFEIAGEDRKFYPANAVIIDKNIIEVNSEKVIKPVAVRYAFTRWAQGKLYSSEELPVAPFRTDDWEL